MHLAIRWPLLAAIACATLVAACGGSGPTSTTTTSTSSSRAAPSPPAQTSTSSSAAVASSSSSSSIPSLGAGASGAAVAAECSAALNAARPELGAAQFSRISGYCSTLSHYKPSQLKGALKTICNEIVNGLPAATRSGERVICANL